MKTLLAIFLMAQTTFVIAPGQSLNMDILVVPDGTTTVIVNNPQSQPHNNILPDGRFDVIDATTGIAYGWSYDPNNQQLNNEVHIYVNGINTPIGIIIANGLRQDVNQALNITGNHGWSFQIPEQHRGKLLIAYGMDLIPGATPTLLSGSPKLF